jgi:hypothetical protein
VASIDRADDRDILEGTLGCPVCLAEYPIRDGIVLFSEHVVRPSSGPLREEDAVRLAAALDLTEARMTAILHGTWGALAPIMRGLTPAQLLLVNPPDGITSGDGISIVYGDTAPLAHGAIHAAAVDDSADAAMIASLVASLRPGARMLGPLSVAIPPDLTELVRDDEVWVALLASSAATSAPIQLTRRQ